MPSFPCSPVMVNVRIREKNMNKLEIATLSFRILSIYFLFKILDQADNLIYFIANYSKLNEGNFVNYLMAIVPAILYFILGIFLWFSSPRLAHITFKKNANITTIDLSLENVQLVAFSIAGFFLVASAAPQLSDILVNFIAYNFNNTSFEGKFPFHTEIILGFIKIVVGTWLLLGPRGIVNFINSSRRE
jgi:hypothetical protein